MEIDFKVLGKQQIEATTATKRMQLSENASQIIFQMFTETIYSNPIGTVVREITSNCFDSHVEAGVENKPVLIKKTRDEVSETTYISFIDYGVGMSPDRVENIYGVYFESTKRGGNEQIGGFGIGGKTPLAYKRITGEGEGDYDNSFFVITNYNGTKYYYTVYEGTQSPEFSLFHKEATDEENGTEVRIPVLEKDVDEFERELVRQLYYFEGLVFDGFSEKVTNEYQIIRGKNFLYRGDDLDKRMHVCLGKVYYPIDYNVLKLSGYDYEIPVAINVPIGSIGVTPSREQIKYNADTIKYLRERIEVVTSELKTMLSKQYDNVQSLEDMFKFKQNFGHLYLTDTKSIRLNGMIKQSEVNLTKYKFNDLKKIDSDELFTLFFDVKTYGKKETVYGDIYPKLRRDYNGLQNSTNILWAERDNYTLRRIKQSYLRSIHGRYYLIIPNNLKYAHSSVSNTFDIDFGSNEDYLGSKEYQRILEMQKDYFAIVQKYTKDYENVQIPDDYKSEYNKPTLTADLLKTTIPCALNGKYKYRIKIQDLVNFKGKIFYGSTTDELHECRTIANIYDSVFNINHKVSRYYNNSKYSISEKFGGNKNYKKSIMFLTVAKNNMKYFNYCKNAYPLQQFNSRILRRKIDEIAFVHKNLDIRNRFSELNGLYTSKWLGMVSKVWENRVNKVKDFVETMKTNNSSDFITTIRIHKEYFNKYFNLEMKETDEEKKIRNLLTKIEELHEKNKHVLRYIELPSHNWHIVNEEMDEKIIPKLLKSIMVLS